MNKYLITLIVGALLMCPGISLAQETSQESATANTREEQPVKLFDHLYGALTLGTTGIGLDLAMPVNDMIQVRAGYTFMPSFRHKMHFNVVSEQRENNGSGNAAATLTSSKFDEMADIVHQATGIYMDRNVEMIGEPTMNNAKLLVDVFCARFVDSIGYRRSVIASEVTAGLGLAGLAFIPDLFADPFIGVMICVVIYAIGSGGVENQISGFTICITDKDGNINKSANAILDNFTESIRAQNASQDNAIVLQTGTKANQAIKIGMTDMRAQALGLQGADGQTLKSRRRRTRTRRSTFSITRSRKPSISRRRSARSRAASSTPRRT